MKRFHGIFNVSGELHHEWTTTERKSRAAGNMIETLSKKLGRSAQSLRLYFREGNRITITEVK